jgi:regulator of replication initiation timing
MSKDVANIFKDVSHMSKDVANIFKDVSHMSKDVTNIFKDVSHMSKDVANIFKNVANMSGQKRISEFWLNTRRDFHNITVREINRVSLSPKSKERNRFLIIKKIHKEEQSIAPIFIRLFSGYDIVMFLNLSLV